MNLQEYEYELNVNREIIENLSYIRIVIENRNNVNVNNNWGLTIETFDDFFNGENFPWESLFDNFDYDELTIGNFIDNLNFEDVKVSLSEEQINQLLTIIVNKDNKDNYTNPCSICLEEYNINDKLLELKCKHYYHYNCIYPWISRESTKCPSCRQSSE